jgi:ligand-binding sensor domain-containing protein
MKKLLLFSLLMLLINPLYAQNPEWINYTHSSCISCNVADGDFVWIGTDGGLAKIDTKNGNTIFYNRGNSGLPDNWVNSIAIDASGNKWIGTTWGGLAKFDETKPTGTGWTIYNTSNSGLPSDLVCSIKIDASGNKWIVSGGRLTKFDGQTWTVYNIPCSNPLELIAIDASGNKWIGTWGSGLLKFNETDTTVTGPLGTGWTVYNKGNSGLPSNWVNSIEIDAGGNKWLGTCNGLTKFDGTTWTVYNPSNSGLPDTLVVSLAIDASGNKWVVSSGGYSDHLTKFDDTAPEGTGWTVYNTPNSNWPYSDLYSIAIDASGNKWVGTLNIMLANGGVAKFDETKPTGTNWTLYNDTNSGVPDNTVLSIAIDASGNKWIGAELGGLAKFDGTNYTGTGPTGTGWTVYNWSNSDLPSNGVNSIAIDASGNKWIGANTYFVMYDGNKWTEIDPPVASMPNDGVTSIAIDASGNKWIGTYGGGLAKYDGTKWTVYNTSNSGLPSDIVTSIEIDASGNKWIGSYNGLAKFDETVPEGTNWIVYNTSTSGLPNNFVSSIAIDASGNKWIGTYNGLAKFDETTPEGTGWTVYDTSNSGLPGNIVTSIAIEANGNKWIGTEFDEYTGSGLAKFDETAPEGTGWTVYNTSNSGLSSNRVTSITIDKDGNKWVGTRKGGLCVFKEGGVVLDVEENNNNNTIPKDYSLMQNYPNPFNPSTVISYRLPVNGHVTLKVYDILGKEIATLVNVEKPAGSYSVNFNGSNLSSGVYIYRIQAGSFTQSRKLVLLK